jgi:DNA-binding transcriptional ArsR family regulator
MPRSALTKAEVTHSATLFFALGDETRLRLVARLSHNGPMNIARLTDGFGMTRQAISKHLRVMKRAGLVSSERIGRERIWELEEKRLAEAQRHLQTISAQWDQTLDRLKRFVE